jgi:dUTP pyrophosphatase
MKEHLFSLKAEVMPPNKFDYRIAPVLIVRTPMSLTIEIDDAAKDVATLYSTVKTNHRTDSGFDIFMPFDVDIPEKATKMLDLGIRCQFSGTSGYYLYPRSSISKTPLRLANSVGIIDAGYRGTLKVMVDNTSFSVVHIKKGDRLFQLCLPSLEPFDVVFGSVSRETERGEGGFGSTNSAK